MTDPVNPPVEPVVEPTPPQPVETPPVPKPQESPEGFVEKARYDGLTRKVEELTLTNRSLTEQLTEKSSKAEQLTGQLAIKDTDKSVAVGEYQKQLEAALVTQGEQTAELSELRAVKAKMELVRKHNAGHLIPILDRIPFLEDEEAMEIVFTDFLKWGDDMAKKREGEIMAGFTPPGGTSPVDPGTPPAGTPDDKDAWLAHIQKQAGGADTEKAWSEYFEWGQQQTTE